MKNIIILSFIAFVLFSCTNNQPAELDEEQKAAIEQEVMEINKKQISSFKHLDLDIMSEFWYQDELIGVNLDYMYFDTYSEFIDSASYRWSLRESQNVTLEQSEVEVLAANLAVTTSIHNSDVTFKDGTSRIGKNLNTILWKKGEDGWKIILLHQSWK